MNRLEHEASLYLRQHAGNPVDWYPWGDEAFAAARDRGVPVLLSIGYSSCHWCHVMAHESFEDDEVAAVMNELFVNVKVDREERPDVDSVYMDAVQAMTGQGGWPLTVFLTADGAPFWGGTYFPREARHGMPGIVDVLRAVREAHDQRRDEVDESAARLTQRLAPLAPDGAASALDASIVAHTAEALLHNFDATWGGFEPAPKFPPPMAIELLLRAWLRDPRDELLHAATHTLDRMLWGGIYDQVGGGFHRYSVDGRWLVPHFEKMLYDNAQLARSYLVAWQLTGRAHYRRAVTETFDFLLREMRLPGGGFAASQDADSEGVEGAFYVWTRDELVAALGPHDGAFVADIWQAEVDGNFDGTNVLWPATEPTPEEWQRLAPLRERLRELRARRPAPATDPKVVAGWNGLLLGALAQAAAVLERDDYLDAARALAGHLLGRQSPDGQLRRTWTPASQHDAHAGTVGEPAFAEDLAAVGWGLLALYEATGERRWIDAARGLGDELLAHFDDAAAGGFHDTGAHHAPLLVRPKGLTDHPVPSGNSMAATLLARLAQWFPDAAYRDRATAAIALVQVGIARMPTALAQAAVALDHLTSTSHELAVLGDAGAPATRALAATAWRDWRPHLVLSVGAPGDDLPLLAQRDLVAGEPTAYLCSGFACQRPATGVEQLVRDLAAVH